MLNPIKPARCAHITVILYRFQANPSFAAGLAIAVQFQNLSVRLETLRRRASGKLSADALVGYFVNLSAMIADQKNMLVIMFRVLAGDKGTEAFDFGDNADRDKRLKGTINAGWLYRAFVTAGDFFQELIGGCGFSNMQQAFINLRARFSPTLAADFCLLFGKGQKVLRGFSIHHSSLNSRAINRLTGLLAGGAGATQRMGGKRVLFIRLDR